MDSSLKRFDLLSGKFDLDLVAQLPESISGHTFTAVSPSTDVEACLLIGGIHSDPVQFSASCHIMQYDQREHIVGFTKLASLNVARCSHVTAVFQGTVYVLGGVSNDGSTIPLDRVVEYINIDDLNAGGRWQVSTEFKPQPLPYSIVRNCAGPLFEANGMLWHSLSWNVLACADNSTISLPFDAMHDKIVAMPIKYDKKN
jgi:hypothetical protein